MRYVVMRYVVMRCALYHYVAVVVCSANIVL